MWGCENSQLIKWSPHHLQVNSSPLWFTDHKLVYFKKKKRKLSQVVDRMNCLWNSTISSRRNTFKMFLPIGFDGNRPFCSNCHVLQQIILAVLSSRLASPWATVWDFTSHSQWKAEAEWHPCSSSLFYSRVWQIQTQAWLSVPWSNDISWLDHKVLLAILCWVFMVYLKSTSESLWWEQPSKMFDQKN